MYLPVSVLGYLSYGDSLTDSIIPSLQVLTQGLALLTTVMNTELVISAHKHRDQAQADARD